MTAWDATSCLGVLDFSSAVVLSVVNFCFLLVYLLGGSGDCSGDWISAICVRHLDWILAAASACLVLPVAVIGRVKYQMRALSFKIRKKNKLNAFILNM